MYSIDESSFNLLKEAQGFLNKIEVKGLESVSNLFNGAARVEAVLQKIAEQEKKLAEEKPKKEEEDKK